LDYRSHRRLRKFYREQVTTIVGLLENHFKSQTKKFEEYLLVCERLGKEPNLAKIPMDKGNYPYEVQLAMSIHEVLPDRWDGMSGSYLGKDWSSVGTYLDAYETEDKPTVLLFIKILDVEFSKVVNENLDTERNKRERKDSQANIQVPKIK
jgi:hypothetical protein